MAKFTIIRSLCVLIAIVTLVKSDALTERDEWYLSTNMYDDLPRVFQLKDTCPYENFYLDCNKCECSSTDSKPVCTLNSCPKVPQIVNWGTGKECPADKHFYWKCNDCYCTDNGTNAACTKKWCPNVNAEDSDEIVTR